MKSDKGKIAGVKKAQLDYGNKDVVKEAKQGDKKGAITKAEGGKVPGKATGGRLDKRARGGRSGSDKNPFSSAYQKGG
jgi:hypothetical protein